MPHGTVAIHFRPYLRQAPLPESRRQAHVGGIDLLAAVVHEAPHGDGLRRPAFTERHWVEREPGFLHSCDELLLRVVVALGHPGCEDMEHTHVQQITTGGLGRLADEPHTNGTKDMFQIRLNAIRPVTRRPVMLHPDVVVAAAEERVPDCPSQLPNAWEQLGREDFVLAFGIQIHVLHVRISGVVVDKLTMVLLFVAT